MREREHVEKDRGVVRKKSLVDAKPHSACDQNDVPVWVPEFGIASSGCAGDCAAVPQLSTNIILRVRARALARVRHVC